ncbi:hypothetical protein [Flavisolibacter ginsengisoli]|jgi:hypothetical protein|uniref:Uncharacterized protein n=1 Tax=Flavisolibacter ginsengisoli DSM 18119 TaxID=1121884 RepID=A0A1M5BJ37_9BACT|nr:hypothetical protein [Flavisolibacter ginsengisoli]SHF42633.1 hypothetical protein SAMN02745131_02612 [Flavisolibacter ginsengisoli DSM 18119]
MEFVWMIPLYIIIPLTGIILLFKGFNADKGHGRKRIGLGFILLSLPFLHAFMVDRIEASNEKSLIGSYALESSGQVVLNLHPDKTFELAKLDSVKTFGKGTWQYRRWDIDEVDLTFADSNQLSFEVFFTDKGKTLQNSFWTGTSSKFVKLVSIKNEK